GGGGAPGARRVARGAGEARGARPLPPPPPHLPLVDLADLGLLREALDDLDGLQSRRLVGRSDRNLARIFDVDLAARVLDDRPDGLAARADHVPDPVARYLHREDARRIGRDVG